MHSVEMSSQNTIFTHGKAVIADETGFVSTAINTYFSVHFFLNGLFSESAFLFFKVESDILTCQQTFFREAGQEVQNVAFYWSFAVPKDVCLAKMGIF